MGIRSEINTKRLFTKEVFARLNTVNIDLLMQIVWDGAINGLDIRRTEQVGIILCHDL